jgi:hypothetical protein
MSRNATTVLGRIVVGLFGLGLLMLGFQVRIWSTMHVEGMLMFGALAGLFLGYALGGDLWGARLFDLFAHTQSRKVAEEPLPPRVERIAQILGVLIAGLLILIALIHCNHRDAAEVTPRGGCWKRRDFVAVSHEVLGKVSW